MIIVCTSIIELQLCTIYHNVYWTLIENNINIAIISYHLRDKALVTRCMTRGAGAANAWTRDVCDEDDGKRMFRLKISHLLFYITM